MKAYKQVKIGNPLEGKLVKMKMSWVTAYRVNCRPIVLTNNCRIVTKVCNLTLFPLYYIEGVLCGPLHTTEAVEAYKNAIEAAKAQGGTVAFGGKVTLSNKSLFSFSPQQTRDKNIYLFYECLTIAFSNLKGTFVNESHVINKSYVGCSLSY